MAPNPENLPLRATPVWPKSEFSWLHELEAAATTIREELLQARRGEQPSGFQPYLDPKQDGTPGGEPGTDRGQWNVMYLFLNHKKFPETCEKFPKTVAAIESIMPRHYSHAFFSALAPGTHIKPHCGPSNKMLRCHLPLLGLEGARLHVADQVITYSDNEAVVWDHAFRHEAFHEGSETRVVLIVDFWHPDLTDEEVRFLETLRSAKLRVGRQIAEITKQNGEGLDGATNHFTIIDAAKGLLTDDDWWVINAEADPSTRPT
jgi:aspartate beta-hydroxylase